MSYVIQGKAINIIIKPSIHDLLRNCKIIDGGRSGRFLYYVLEKEGKKYIIVATYIHDHTAVYFIIFENFDKWKNEDIKFIEKIEESEYRDDILSAISILEQYCKDVEVKKFITWFKLLI